jgi:tetratricopeptide (TPR) repeat protein
MTQPCPPDDILAALLADRLPPEAEGELEDHLARCPTCRGRLDNLTGWADDTDGRPAADEKTGLSDRLVTTVAARLAQVVRVDARRPRAGTAALPSVTGYDLLAEVGRGGCAVVYRAVDRRLGRTVALKLLQDRAGPETHERFRREAAALGRLRHPNVVQIYGVGEEDGQPFLALEYVSGGSLARFTAGQPQDPAAAAGLVEALARGIGAANRAGFVHRDLKPANVLLDPRPGGPDPASLADFVPKVTDFGVVKSLAADPGLTDTRDFLGTPSYMAPEQAGTRRPVDQRTDVYALGAILYELLTGHPPFRAATPIDTLVQVAFERPVPPSRTQPRLPRDVETVCLKCLEKDPARRYATADGLADDLARFRAGRPVVARPVRWPTHAWRWCRRSPGRAALVGLAAAVVIAVAVGGPIVARREHALRRQADEQRERARQHFDLASKALDETLGGLVVNARLRAYGMDDVRADLLRQAVPYLKQFAAEENDAADIRVRQGRAAIQLATVAAKDSDRAKAAAEYRRGIALFERLTAGPDGAPFLVDLAVAHMEYGRFLALEVRDPAAADHHLREALRIADNLDPDDAGSSSQQDHKANVLSLLGMLPTADGKGLDERRGFLERACSIRDRLAAQNPDRTDLRRYATMTTMNLATHLNTVGLHQEAVDRLARALAGERALAATTAASLEGPRLRADLEGLLGATLGDLGRVAEGMGHVREAVRMSEAAARLFPADAEFTARALLWHDTLATLLELDHQVDQAVDARRAAVALATEMVAAAPAVDAHRVDLLAAHLTFAELLARLGRAGAAAEFAAAEAAARQLPAVPSDPERIARRAGCFHRLAVHDLTVGRFGDALAWLDRAVGLIDHDPQWTDSEFRRDVELRRAAALDQLGRPAEAAAARARANRCRRQSTKPAVIAIPAPGSRIV